MGERCEKDQTNPQPGDPPGLPTQEERVSERPIDAPILSFFLVTFSSAVSFVLVEELWAPD